MYPACDNTYNIHVVLPMYNITQPLLWRHMHDTSSNSLSTLWLCIHHTDKYVTGRNVHVKQYCEYAQTILHLDFHARPITYQKCPEHICLLSLFIPRVFPGPYHMEGRPLDSRLPLACPWTPCCALDSPTSAPATRLSRSAVEQRRRLSLANPICSGGIVTFNGSTS